MQNDHKAKQFDSKQWIQRTTPKFIYSILCGTLVGVITSIKNKHSNKLLHSLSMGASVGFAGYCFFGAHEALRQTVTFVAPQYKYVATGAMAGFGTGFAFKAIQSSIPAGLAFGALSAALAAASCKSYEAYIMWKVQRIAQQDAKPSPSWLQQTLQQVHVPQWLKSPVSKDEEEEIRQTIQFFKQQNNKHDET